METLNLRQRIDSETLTLPELRPFIGREVRITVVAEGDDLEAAAAAFWNPPSLAELARRQGVGPATPQSHRGSFSADDFDGFDAFLDGMRGEPGRGR